MAKVYDSVLDLVGKTPLLNAHSFKENNKLDGNILVKLEYFNPATPASVSPLSLPPKAIRSSSPCPRPCPLSAANSWQPMVLNSFSPRAPRE